MRDPCQPCYLGWPRDGSRYVLSLIAGVPAVFAGRGRCGGRRRPARCHGTAIFGYRRDGGRRHERASRWRYSGASTTTPRVHAVSRSGCASCREPGIVVPADAALAARKGQHLDLHAYDSGTQAGQPLTAAAVLPEYRAEQTVPLGPASSGRAPADPIYVRADVLGRRYRAARLLPAVARERTCAEPGADTHGCGCCRRADGNVRDGRSSSASSCRGSIFVWYAALFFVQALYVVFISGQGFDWPRFGVRRP